MNVRVHSIIPGAKRSGEQDYLVRIDRDDVRQEFVMTVSESGVETDEVFRKTFDEHPQALQLVYAALAKASRKRLPRERSTESRDVSPDTHPEKPVEPFDIFHREMQHTLMDFLTQCGFDHANKVLTHAILFLPALDGLLREVEIHDDTARDFFRFGVAAFIGEYLVQKYRGTWILTKAPSASAKGRYSVGRFAALDGNSAVLEPLEEAHAFLNAPPPRELAAFLAQMDEKIKRQG